MKINGSQVYTRSFGSGYPVLLLPGWPLSSAIFELLRPYADYELTSFDFPGWAGKSTGTITPDINSLVEFTNKFIDKKGYDKLCIGGISIGGTIALLTAFDNNKVEKVFVQSSPYNGSYFRKHFKPQVKLIDIARDHKMLASLLKLAYLLPKEISAIKARTNVQKELKKVVRDDMKNMNTNHVLEFAYRFFNSDFEEHMKKVEQESLIVGCKKDKRVPSNVSRKLSEILPKSKFKLVEGTHSYLLENPKEFSEILSKFVGTRN